MRKLFTRVEKYFALCVILCIGLPATRVHGLVIRVYDPNRHDRFSSGYPNSPVENTNFHAAFYDFSGVGWNAADPTQSFTLISPRHFVGANHYKPGIGATLVFRGRDGLLRSFGVSNQYNVTNAAGQITDLFIGEINRSIVPCDTITFYPVLNLASEAGYVGRSLLVYGKTARVGKGTISAFQDFGGDPITGGAGINSTRAYSFAYVSAIGGNDDSRVEGGDSGSPSLVATNGELFVVGVHTAVLSTGLGANSFDTFVPHYLDQIDSILQLRGFHPATTPSEVFQLCYQLTPLEAEAWQISWVGQRGRVYQLYGATNVFNFVPVSGLITANVATVTYIDSNAVDRVRFYRVRRMDSP